MLFSSVHSSDINNIVRTGRDVTRTLIGGGGGGVYIHIFMFCSTSFFLNQIQIDQFEKKLVGQTWIYEYTPPQLTF